MANRPSDLYSEPIYENVSESDTCKPDVDVRFEPSSELIEYYDTERPVDDQEKQKLQSSECPNSAQSDPIHDVLRSPEYHDRSLSPATRLRSQDLSYAEILALGLRKQAKAQNIITLPKPQVAEVEMVKEIVVEVEKAPPIIHFEPRVEPTDSSRIKPERLERPFQRSRSRDMPRQRRAPEKRPTKSHDMQTIKKKKTSRRVIEVENFDDSPESIEPTMKPSDTSIYRTIEKFEEPKIEKSCKEITKKVHHSATVVETVVENVFEDVPQEPLKTELEQKKPKKKNKHKKVKEIDDEIEKALKEIEESDRHKKRKIKDSRDKSKEMIKGVESDETEQHAEVTKKSLEAMADTKEVTSKQKKKKIHKDSKTSKHKKEKSETNIHHIESTDHRPTAQSSNLAEEMLPIVESDDSDSYNLVERGDKYSSVVKNKKGNINKNLNDVKSANEAIGNVSKVEDKLNQNEMNTQSVTTSFTRTKEEHEDLKNEESDAEKASKQKKKKKGKKQGQSPEHNEQKLITTEVVKLSFEENVKIIEPIDEKISNEGNKTEEIKPHKLVPLESSDSIKEKVQLGNTLDRSKPNDDVESIHPKNKLMSKKLKSTESKNKSQEPSLSEALGTTDVILEDKDVENVVEQEFMEVKELEQVASSEKLKEKCVELKYKQREVTDLESDLVTMDWNTLMAEEENVLESEVAQIKQPIDETDASQTSTQVASEVTILTEISNIVDMKAESEQRLENAQMKEMVQNEMSATSSPNEQNNNDKIFSSDLLKNSPLNIVEEITRYEPIVKDIETRTIYLITHEEKKLPPIRTVKVFSTKSNSLETETQGESTSDTIHTFVNKDTKIIDKNISRGTSENAEDVIEGQISTECIEEFSQYAQDPNLNNEAKKYCLEQVYKVDSPHEIVENSKNIDNEMIIGQEKLENVKNISNTCRSTLTTDEEGDNYLHLDAKHEYNVGRVSDQMEEFSENILEHAIFGSVQDRKRPTFIKTSSIPYQELVEEIKTYSLNLDIDQLDFDYHKLMIDEEGEDSLNVDNKTDVLRQCLDKETTNNDLVKEDSAESYYEKPAKETAATSLNMSDAPHFNYYEMKDAEKSFASLITIVTDLKSQEKENKNIDQNLSNLLKTFVAGAILNKNDCQDNADSIIKENKPSKITPIPFSEINIDADHAVTNMQKTHKISFEKTQIEDYKAVNLIESTKSEQIGVVLIDPKFEERKIADNVILNMLHDDIMYFNYSAIADSEKLLASYIDRHVETVSEDETHKTVLPIPNVNQNDRNLVSISNEFDIQEEKLKVSGNANCDSEVITSTPNIQNESKLKAVMLSGQNDIYKTKQSITLLLENLSQELPRYSHYDILDAEKVYPSLINVCDLNRNVTAPDNINAAVDTDTLIKDNILVLHQQSVDASKENDNYLKSSCDFLLGTSISDMLLFEIPKYDYHERNKSEALLASVEQYTKGNKVLLEEPKTITDSDSHKKVIKMLSEGVIVTDSIQQSSEKTAFNNVPVQNYHEICDAENLYASTLIKSEDQYLTSVIDKNMTSSGKDIISLTTPDNDKKLLDIPIKTNTFNIKLNPKLNLEENADNFGSKNTEEIEKECKDISQTNNNEFSKESIHEINLVQPLKTYIDFCKPPNCNYMEIREAECILALKATVLCLTSLKDNKQQIDFPDNHDKSVVNDEIKLNPEENIEFDVTNKRIIKPEAPVLQEFSDSLVPVVFGDVSEISKMILDKETNLTKSQKKDLDDTQKDSTTVVLTEDTVEDFVIVENLQNQDQDTPEALDFEHSFEVIDIEKDISYEMKCLDEQSSLTGKSEISSIIEENDASSSKKTVQEVSRNENVQEKAESPKPENTSQTIAPRITETEISSSVCMTQDNTDLKDTHGNYSNVTSTDPYVDISTDVSSDLVSDQSVLTETVTNNNTRPEKSPIHSLHDLLPEIDSIPEFKPSFSNTILFSKLSADAPEFTPSYMYQTGDNQFISDRESECKQINTPTPSLSNTQQLLQTDEHQAGITTAPVTYSSVLLSQKEKVESADISKEHLSQISEGVKTDDSNIGENVDSKSKRNKKKKKKEDKKEDTAVKSLDDVYNVPASDEDTHLSDTINIWSKAKDDGKSYAEVLAEGLDERKESLQYEQNIDQLDVKDLSDVVLDKPESYEKDIEFITITSPAEIESYEVCGSWAKVVASNRPSPERTQKDIIHSNENKVITKTPVILVDESDSEHHKLDVEIDAEGFITVDRSRRSRSRSRDDRLTNVSKTYKKNDAREKSENRFDALTCTLKPDDCESVQSSHSDDEKELIKKGRKSRSSKSREKDVKEKLVQTAVGTTNDDKQPVKKDKRKRSSKSKEKINKELETFESTETLKQIVEAEPIDVKKVVQQNIQPLQEEAVESKKKAKKKKKEKKLIKETNDAPLLIEITSSEQESSEQKHHTVTSKCIETPISTPESLRTPVKDRFYSEVQYWKVDPNTLDDSSTLSEILTVEVEHDTKTEHANLVTEGQLQDNKISPIDTEILDKDFTNVQTEASSLTTETSKENITDEQSLENKMADLQREIEEMLLPENDASVTSEETPKELADMQISLDEQHDEIFENITPSFASPEPEEIYGKAQVIEFDSTLADHEISTKIITVENHTIISDKTVTVAADKEKPADKHVEGVNSLTSNISPTTTTNSITDLKLDNFWISKSIADDAEKTFVRQTLLDLSSSVPSEEMVQSGSDTNSELIFSDNNKILNNLITDTFWPEKHLYHDAECEYFSQIAQKTKFQFISNADIEVTDKRDKDKDPGGGSGHSSDVDEPRESSGSPFDSNYISMDLPGGICSWKDHSSYLSLETPTDSLTGIVNEGTSLLGTDIPEDKLTNLSLEPDASFPPVQEPALGEDENRTTAKDDLSNSLEILLEEVKIVQAQLSDLPNETLDAMEAGLKEGIAVLVKCEEAAILLEQKIMEFNQGEDVQALLKELIVMKARISKLLIQARQGLQTIKDARIEIENQSKQIEEQKEKIGKLDNWLDAINTELKESAKDTDVLTEEDIIKYIEIYERYIKEYEKYEIILRTITVISHDESSQSMQIKINALKKALEESKPLVISEIERLRQILLNMKFAPEVVEEEVSQTDRTIDSTSMPEEIASSEEIEPIGLVPTQKSFGTSIVPDSPTSLETKDRIFVDTKVEVQMTPNIEDVKNTVVKESQTGNSLISDAPSMHDKSIICQPQIIETHDVSLTCAPPQDVEVQTSEQKSHEGEFLENIQVTQTISDGHETIVISSKPVLRDQQADDHSLLVDADYRDDFLRKNSQLNITHSLPQAFETVMVEPDETTTEVVVDADGTKRIIVKKIRKTLVTRQQTVQMQPQDSQIMSGEKGALQEQSFQQIILKEDKGSSSTTLGDGRIQNVQYQTYGGQVITGLPGREMTIQEITSKPEMVISMEKGMSPDQILQVAEGEVQPQIQTSSSVTAVVEQVTKRIIKTRRRIIRRVVIIDGKEHVSEEIIEEPDTVEVLEEQIPKVSINVKESNIPVGKDDSPDSNNQPSQLTSDSSEKEKPLKDKTPDGKCTDKSEDLPEEVTTTTSRDLQNLTKQNDPEHSDTKQEYIQSRLGALEREIVPSLTCLTPENICLEPQQFVYEQIDSQNKKSAMLTGEQLTQSEALSSHFASVTQTVTRKITRTRKRIIKHIEIIDGKENITEEIIEEPDDVEIIEEEPKITHQFLDQGIKMKKFKIIRQVQMIDGKERVTEQMIEESDDTDNSEPQITTKSYIEVCDKDKPTELEQNEIMMMKNKPEDFIDITKRLISSETDHTIATKTSPVKSIDQSVKQDVQNNELLKCMNITKDVKDKKDENIPEINIPVTTSHKVENISKEIDQKLVTVHSDNKREVSQSLYLPLVETEKTGRNDDTTTDTTQKLSYTNEKEEALNLDSKSFIKTEKIPSLPSTLQHEIQQGDPTQGSSTNLSDDIEKTKPETISAATYLQGNNMDIITNKPTTKIIKTRTRVIKHIQIIDGKEHVKEEIVEEPEEVELFITDPKTYVMQEEGVKTKRLRIIRNIQIIDGKEHVTEKILEDPDCEYMPDSTVTANIDLQVSQSTEPHLESNIKNLESNIKNNKEQDPQCRILEETLTTDQQKGISSIDISKSFIDREIDHAEIIREPPFSYNEQTERDKILVAKSQTDSNKEITSQPEVNPEITKVEYKTSSPEVSSKEEQKQKAEFQYTSPITTSPVYSSQKTVTMGAEDNLAKDDKTVVLEEPKESTSALTEEATSKHEKLSTQNQNASKDVSQKASLMDITKTLLSSEIDHTAMINTFKSEERESKVNSEKVFILEESALAKTFDKPTVLETSQNKTETSDLTETVIPSYHIIQAKHKPESEEETVTNKIILTHSEIGDSDLINIPKDHKPSSDVESSQIKSKHDMTLEESELDDVIIKEDNTSVKQPFEHQLKIPKEIELTQVNTPESVTYSDLAQFKSEVTLKEAQIEDLQTKFGKEIALTFSESRPNIVNASIKDPDYIDITHDQDVKSSLKKIVKQTSSNNGQEIAEHIKRKEGDDCLPESTIPTQKDVLTSKPGTLTDEDKVIKDTNEGVSAKSDKSVLDITKELISKETGHTSQLSTLQKQWLDRTEALEETRKDMKDDDKICSEKIDTNTRSSLIGSANLSDINNPLSKASNTIKSSSTSDSTHIDQPSQDYLPVIDNVVIDSKFDSSTKPESEEPLKQNQLFNKEQPTGHIIVDEAITQSSVGVQPLYAESIVTESHTAAQPTTPDLSYIKQFDPETLLYDDTNILKQTLVPNETISKSDQTPISDTKHKVIAFIEQERNDTYLSNLSVFEKSQGTQTADSKVMVPKTVDINMSIEKTDTRNKIAPNIQLNLKVEDYESQNPFVAKKDVDISLPAEIKITNEPRNECPAKENLTTDALTVHSICADILPEEKEKVRKKSKKNKKQKRPSECGDSFETDVHTDTDRTINDTESSSLGHYVELPVSPFTESPTPSKNLLQENTAAEVEPATSPVESESTAENKGYEPEDISTCSNTAPDKRKRHKKRKAQRLSDDTIYPKQSSTDDDTLASMSIGTDEDTKKIKDADKKEKEEVIESIAISSDVKPTIIPELGEIVVSETISTSPKEESCQTISEASDLSTVKIVEECVGSSPEMVKTEIPTIVTYPIRVVEEVLTQEYSMQTSPEIINDLVIPQTESKIKPFTAKTTDSELQTSPISVGDSFVQTMPKEDKEAHTQTVADNVIPDKVEVQDSQNQTSGLISPDFILTYSEAVTQVVPRDINYFEEKFSQTSSPITELRKETEPLVELECREIQTSPTPQIQQDEKSTEIIIHTTDSNIQTIKQENIDKETSTSPLRVKVASEISVQTPQVSYVNVFTQPEEDISKLDAKQKLNEEISRTPLASEYDSEKEDKVLIDISQQTTPRSVESIGLQIDNTQQTSPRLPSKKLTVISQAENTEIEGISTDKIQQTSPRSCSENNIIDIKRELITVDSMLQTSPLTYSDDSVSTSTDDPYEIHLRAQISIPQVTGDFINIERQIQEPAQSIVGDKSKQKKRRSKKKAESPLQSPSSLSDPINAELSLSVTPTSEDISSRQTDSVDEGISHISSQALPTIHQLPTQPKLTYSDVVQRSKSKSPSPSKSALPSRKSEKARLIDCVEKRTQSIAEPQKNIEESMAVSLIEPSMEKSYALVVDKELSKLRQSVEFNDTNKLEKSVIIVIETISIWLEEIQHKIQIETVTGTKVTDRSERLKDLQNYIRNLKQIIYVTEVNEEIITLIETLTRQVEAVNNLSNQSSVKVKEIEKEWNKFLEDTEILSLSIEKVKSRLDKIIVLELSVQQKLDELDKIETENIDNTDIVRKMFRRFRSIVEANPKRECPTKLYSCDENTKQIENSVNTERDRLMQLMSLAEEYEQTLQDFGQITDVAEALLDGKIIVSDLDHLHEEIQKHRKFFVNLSHCRAILESLEDNLDSETRAKFSSLHNSLHDRATKIIDRAAGRAQQMTLAASRWSILDNGMKEEQQWLRVAHQRIPDLTNVTSMDHEQYINLYQSISLDVSHHYAKMLRLLSIAESLQHLITCSGLESVCSIALDTLLTLQDDIDSRLTKLRAFKENWVAYEHLIDRVENWMKLANRELENITPENITTTPNLRRFWELKAQHEVHHNLKNESGIQFEKALEILPISDEMVQRQFFLKIEDKWRNLAAKIDNLHTTAIQNISDRDVSSSEKLHILEEELRELRASLDGLKGVIKSEDELNLYIERLQVMTGRIDRIQNELGRLSLLPTAESDRLGALLSQSGILNDQIAEELERSLILKEKIMQVQAGIVRCQKNQRRARLTLEECEAAERLGSDVVERASETCQRLLEDLATQWQDILTLRQALHTLPISLRVCVSPTGVERDISALQETHAEIEAACNDLCARLRAKLQLWRRYERQLELVQGAVREADYMVELLTIQGQVDYDRLLKATEKLETLSESLSRRNDELVGELREAAAPLEATTEPAVAAQLRRELDDAAAAYEHTCTNLTQMCDKYQRAVELWRRYREAASAVRAAADAHEARLHALRPADAPAAARACLEQEARVAELRSLAAQVAAETGSRALQADADALARRLQLVAGAVQALADLGEARQLARAKAQNAKDKLCDMRQDLAPVEEDGEIVEHKLIALRDNLIALGKSEADIAPAKAQLPEIDRDVSEEHSIVRILELWQAMFRDTFLHYHRLSTALVRSGDAATALKLWHEYLLDLQSFLSGSLPADYENLTEHRRLCRVHRNLLTSQRSVLMNENKETNNRDLADKFDTLTNLHNETLARIVERHDEVCTRIAAWDDYREIYTELLRWLKEMEREKEKLQLRYVHIKRIHKILSKIQNLYDKLPEGRKFADKLSVYLKRVLAFTEETYGASVRMEYAGIVKRVDNLQASLDTWRDFLTRILGLIGEYENLTGNLHKLYTRTQDEVMSYSDEDRLSRPQIKKAIEKYSELRKKIDKTENQIEALSVIQEQLKECLSPQDIRIVNQKVWQMRQQRADLEHQLSIIIHRLQERLEIYTIFDSRISRFSEWMTTLESRLESSSSSSEVSALDPQDLIRRINSEIQAETALKEREYEWLAQTGSSLIDISKKDEKSYSKNTSKQLKDVQERWQKLQETGRSRIAKINELLETISQMEERLTEIRLKLHSIESKLSASVVIEYLTTKAVDEKFQDRDEIHKSIENESSEVGETLNLCELVFNDPDVLKGNFDLRNLRTGVDIVDKKWKNICEMSEQRKNALKEIRKSAELANSLLPKVEKKLDSIEKRVEKVEIRKQRGESDDDSVSKAVIKDLDALEEDVKRLEDAYSRIASARGMEMRGEGADHTGRLRAAVRRWQQLRVRVNAVGTDLQRQFVAAHGKAVVALAEADVRLTRALHLAPTPLDQEATLKELDGVEQEVRECEALVKEADRLEAALGGVGGTDALASEYRTLLADVTTRLQLARQSIIADVDTAVQVDTLKWETDAALQVDTLTSKETYRVELAAAVRETSESLEALRTALMHELKENASGDELATAAKEIAKAGAKPGQTLELAKHLSELLLTECDATEEEAMLKEVESLSMRYEDLLTQAKKRELQINNLRLPHSASYALTCEHESGRLTCPLCSDRNWKQLDNDLWRLEQWLQFAEATDEARTDPPEQYDALEDAIQDHREFLLDLDSHKALVVSLNVVGAHVAAHARSPAAGERARARLAAANARWDAACARAADWQRKLQRALVHNQQFHDIVVELVSQLSAAERCVRAREPLRLRRAADELRRDFRRFSELRDELARAEPRVQALRDAAALLQGLDSQDVCRRLGELRLRLQSLRKLAGVYALKLGAALAHHPSAGVAAVAAAAAAPQLLEEEEEQMSSLNLPPLDASDVALSEENEEHSLSRVQRGLRFVCRVARASLPFQALLLLLLGAATLVPHAHSDCRPPGLGLEPVLRYPDGPPPL